MASCGRLASLALLAALPLAGERLPVKLYTTADGLARNRVQRIMTDSRGLIWIATSEGLSRFDGYGFVNYGTRDGLASRLINAVLEGRDGTYWVGTDEGLCVFHPQNPSRLFSLYHRPEPDFLHGINALLQDRSGAIWAATESGLYRESQSGAPNERPAWIDVGAPHDPDLPEMRALLEDRQGSLWIGGAAGLFRRYPDGKVEMYSTGNGLPVTFVETLLMDSEGRIWAGTRLGLCRIVADPRPGRNIVERLFSVKDGLGNYDIKALALASDGSIWAGALSGGLMRIRMASDGRLDVRIFGKAEGLSDETIIALAFDRDGNLWVGGESGGLMRIVHDGFRTYTTADGLAADRAHDIFQDNQGNFGVISRNEALARSLLSRFIGEKFQTVDYPPGYRSYGFPLLQDRAGQWWLGERGLRLLGAIPFEQLARAVPQRTLGGPYGPNQAGVYKMFEDSRGGIWFSNPGGHNSLAHWDPSSGMQVFPSTRNPLEQLVTAFAEDHAGNIWMGFYNGGVTRYRAGKFQQFGARDGIPGGYLARLFVDAAGRLWIAGTDGGLGRMDQPSADHPKVRIYDSTHGLSSDSAYSITDDQWGRIYVGTGRGLDRLDPATDRVKHYTTADGLANDQPQFSFRDRNNWLWFATTKGMSVLIPEPDRPRPPPAIRITALGVAGKPYTISQLGETSLAGLEFPSGEVRIEFAGINFAAGEVLRYQYRLEAEGAAWSAPTDQRSVNLAGLSPGSYRFRVRAVESNGQVSELPASIDFHIPPPIWGRLWFRVLAIALGSLLLYGLYRFRLDRMLELEHIRTRIATDLHDDIGSSLSQIAILSEVARRPGEAGTDALDPLGRIARISRELVDSMSDIVWAVNPSRDNLRDLTRRMRQFAGEMLVPGGIDFSFDAEGAPGDVALGADLRRQVFLIFKECLNNAARHSGAGHVDVVFRLSGGWLHLGVRDNGRGFDPACLTEGHGLASMRSRATALGGTLKIDAAPGAGTEVRLAIPLPRRRVW